MAHLPGESKQVYAFFGCGIKSMKPTFKTEMLIYQSKANLDEKILLGNITHFIEPKIRKMHVRGFYKSRILRFILVHDLYGIEV